MNFVQLVLCVLMTFIGAMGAYYFKKAAARLQGINVFQLLKFPAMYIGGTLYCLAALMNIVLLRFIDYSVLYPMTAITYIWTMIIARVFLGETIDKFKIIAVAFICCGVFLIAM